MNTEKMPAGCYYIGDLCYVMHPEWNEFCRLTNVDREGKFTLADGREFVFFNTTFGDGVYVDRQGRQYGVDAGLIGAILVSDVSEEERANLPGGNIVMLKTNGLPTAKTGFWFLETL